MTTSVLPAVCCLCGAPGATASLDLCADCRCELPVNDAADAEDFSAFERVVLPFRYAYPVDHFVRALKFNGQRMYARVLGTLLGQERANIGLTGHALPELIIPMPLHVSRYRKRGFNQAQEIARYAARWLGLPVESRCLKRVIETSEQSGLPLAERVENVRGAFAPARPLRVKHIALVDDVLTTGSTANEAARVLANAGAQQIELWAAARVTLD